MPLREFFCEECGLRFEFRVGWDAPTTAICPACGAEANMVWHAPTVIYKGGGWGRPSSTRAASTDKYD